MAFSSKFLNTLHELNIQELPKQPANHIPLAFNNPLPTPIKEKEKHKNPPLLRELTTREQDHNFENPSYPVSQLPKRKVKTLPLCNEKGSPVFPLVYPRVSGASCERVLLTSE